MRSLIVAMMASVSLSCVGCATAGVTADAPLQGLATDYWLMAANGETTGYLAAAGKGAYAPFDGTCAGDDEGLCELEPSDVSRRCAAQANAVLNAVLRDPPVEWIAFQATYGELPIQGWVNDYNAVTTDSSIVRERMWYGPFNWQGSGSTLGDDGYKPSGTIKWASAVYPDGSCMTPSRAQFVRLLTMMDACARTPGPGCCGDRQADDANEC